jgi:hypothetical protein
MKKKSRACGIENANYNIGIMPPSADAPSILLLKNAEAVIAAPYAEVV